MRIAATMLADIWPGLASSHQSRDDRSGPSFHVTHSAQGVPIWNRLAQTPPGRPRGRRQSHCDSQDQSRRRADQGHPRRPVSRWCPPWMKATPPAEETDLPTITVEELERLTNLSPGDAVKMQYRSGAATVAIRHEASGDRIGALLDRSQADKLAQDAAMALDPVLHTTGRVTTGNGGEIAIGTKQMAPFVDTVQDTPGYAGRRRQPRADGLADKAGSLSMALDASMTITAANSLEKMLMHQAAAAHTAAMVFQAEGRELLQAFKRTGYVHPSLSTEAARMPDASAG